MRIRAALAVLLALALGSAAAGGAVAPARRIVSMNPSLTRILVRLGATDALVGVDEYSARLVPSVAALPRVGSLYSPSLEAVVALRPDLVVLVPSIEQRDFRERLGELGIPVLALAPDPVDLEDVLDAIERLGARVGREAEARDRIRAIRRTWHAVEAAARDLPHPRAVLVIQRDPLFVVGRGSFLDEMMAAAGVQNLGDAFEEPWPRASLEWLVASAPDVLIDSDADPQPAAEFWARWPSLPAVAHGRVVAVPAGALTLPGPDLDRSLLALARAVHGDALHVSDTP